MADYAYEDSEAEPLYVAVNPFLTTRRHRPVSVTSGHVLDPENRNVERSNSQDVVVPFAHTPHPQRLSRQAIGAQSLPAQISSQQLSRQAIGAQSLPAQISSQQLSRQAIGAQSLPTQTSSQRLSRQAIGAQYLPVQPSSQQLSRQAIGAQSLPAQPSSQQLSRQAIGAQSLPAQNPFHSAPPVRRTAQLAIRAPSVPAYTPYYSAVPVTLSHAKSEPEYRHWGRSWRLQSQQMVAPDDEQPSTGPALASAPRLGTVRKAAQLAIGAPSVPAYTPSYSTVPATLSHAVSAPEYRHWQRPWRPKSQQIAVPDVLEDEQTIIQDARLRSHSPTRAPSLSTSTSFESLVEEGWKHDGTMGAVRRERTRSPAPSYHSGPTRTRPSPANLKTSRSYAETQASPHERRGRSPLPPTAKCKVLRLVARALSHGQVIPRGTFRNASS
ncbi:hypothetical protein B0H19DRAFT_169537 [Mycena capillaripes]|nr:hypothetical protein B0H19DRAFT_169537 [Mycena capillaripes]